MAGLSNTIQYKELPAANPRCAVHFEDTKIFVLDHFFKERGKMWRLTIDSNSYLYLSMRRPDVKKKSREKSDLFISAKVPKYFKLFCLLCFF